MKFFHVYNERSFKGLEKNGFINKDTGFKIQHVFSMPNELKFNTLAAKGSKLYNMIKEGNIPFYVDRITGGVTYHQYNFDKALIKEYSDMLGDWFLGFQMHESSSNIRNSDWQTLLRLKNGDKNPWDPKKLREIFDTQYFKKLPDGTKLPILGHDWPEVYAAKKYAETPAEFIEEIKDMITRRMAEVDGHIIPCDSYHLETKIHNDMGIKTFMPEVGCQIPLMRKEVALARGIAKAYGKTWGTYYECWREVRAPGADPYYCMPCFNTDLSNEWYLTQDLHCDDFTTFGENGGSSRILQNRIYYYALMAGAHYFGEEWGLNCSYSDMNDFSLSDYGRTKKDFINTALDFQGIKAKIPFAIVLPTDYSCVELPDMFEPYKFGEHRDVYMRCPLNAEEKAYYGHIEDVLKFVYERKETIGNEGHVITNSKFADVFDIIYTDTPDAALEKYDYLIDATPGGDFAKAKAGTALKILESGDFDKLEAQLNKLIPEVMPCYVDDLCWLVSTDENGKKYLSIFNNEGNERDLKKGNIIHHEADKKVKITFKEDVRLHVVKETMGAIELEKIDDKTYNATIPAAGFAIIEF